MSKKITVGILFGGKSVEHTISILSAKNIVQAIDTERFQPVLIGIDLKGKWYLCEQVDEHIPEGRALSLHLDASAPFFMTEGSTEKIVLDIVFPVLHGTDGEDGSIQGLLQTMALPYVGSGVAGSAMAMDKLISKKLLTAASIPVCPYLSYPKEERKQIDFGHISQSLGLPFISKPASLGSSVGVHKIKDEKDFLKALEETFGFDDTIIFEAFVEGRELECAIMGNAQPNASLPGEITLDERYEFYTFDAKYVDKTAAKLHIPAQVPEDTVKKIKHYSIQAYRALGCEDFARVDLFLTTEGKVFINEINSIPGFTNASMFPKLWEIEGIPYTELISRLIDMGLERAALRAELSTSFSPGAKSGKLPTDV